MDIIIKKNEIGQEPYLVTGVFTNLNDNSQEISSVWFYADSEMDARATFYSSCCEVFDENWSSIIVARNLFKVEAEYSEDEEECNG